MQSQKGQLQILFYAPEPEYLTDPGAKLAAGSWQLAPVILIPPSSTKPRLQAPTQPHSALYIHAGDGNTGPHSHTASGLTSEPHLKPPILGWSGAG